MRLLNIFAALTGACAFVALAYHAHSGAGETDPIIFAALAQLSAAAANLAIANRVGRLNLIGGAVLLAGANIFAGVIQLTAFVGEHPFHALAPVGGSLTILGWLVLAFAKPSSASDRAHAA